ncbi:uncharacterized protein DUF4272 [Roseimicrobium gellanilyticum]|uniref:Uncharacterized protein DUF4272 n=1 Tax=Roseimicrobium gellanilyticum TaxID=748857 RepID=A0A366HPP7_9BACT|nr:DUF4272 domain-containing protein [Roseimicrobium gellanilyticum]RBP43945.1 uncharacterized protein DUF4272 [Roseimicrobium gellanilyticum]
MEDESVKLTERSALEIAERSLVLVAIVAHTQQQTWVADWTRRFGIHDSFSDAERGFFSDSTPDQQAIVNFSWRAEALVSLIWSLGGLEQMPLLSEQCWILDTDFIAAAMKDPNEFRLCAEKRPSEEIQAMEGFLYHQHWRVRDRQLGLNVGAGRPLDPGELPVDALNPSVVYERRYGLSWVAGWGDDWDDVPTDT